MKGLDAKNRYTPSKLSVSMSAVTQHFLMEKINEEMELFTELEMVTKTTHRN